MAHFDKAELLDFIRHSVSLEDDIEQSNLIAQVTRQDIFIISDKRAKYGGLPLNFRNQNPPEEAWDDDDGFYEPPPEPSSTKSLINDRLTSRTSDMTQAAIRNTVLQSTSPISSFLAELRPLQPGCRKQDVTKLLKMQKSPLLAELSDYEQYEGGMDRPSKKILIIIAPNGKSDETTPQLLVTVQSRALLYQLIGLAMFKYVQKTGIELRGHVSDYSLYVADETGEIDTDLPPLDGQTQLSRLGFNVLALVRTQNSNSPKRRTIVTVHLTDHTTYPLEIESMQSTTVKWLLDEVIKRIDEDEDERERQTGIQLLRIRDYTVERVDDDSQPFELTQSLASCGVTDFLIVQKNSSRGDFMPHQGQFGRQMSSNSINLSLPRLPSFNLFEYFNGDSVTPLSSPNRLEHSTSFLDPDDQVCSFIVTKMHRFKPNWKAYFVIRYSGFEINPFSTENMQNSGFFLQGKQKSKCIAWQYVASFTVEKTTQMVSKAPVDTMYLTFWYLNPLSRQQLSQMIDEEMSPLDVKKLYNDEVWKCLKLEMGNREEADEAARQIEALLLPHYDGAIPKVFAFSKNGSIRPAVAAKSALIKENHRSVVTNKFSNFAKITNSIKKKFN